MPSHVLFAALTGWLLVAQGAAAESKDLCLAPHEDGQRLRRDGYLRAARDKLHECERENCPAPVRVDCAKWISELDASIPTVVVHARDDGGRDVTGLRVWIDGRIATDYVEGRPFELDPGRHDLRLEANGLESSLAVLVAEGERNRLLEATLSKTNAPPTAEARAHSARPIPAAAWVTGGVGIAALGVFAAFGYIGWRKHDALRSSCAPHCTDSDRAPIVTDYTISDVALALSVVSFGAATWLVLTRPSVSKAPESSRLVPCVGPGRAGVCGTF
jgi:hypothetical protein